ncbi:MAG: hypothetical protein ACK5JJ_02445 [Cyanobacteriota bacterium]|jgi:hypothetical protein
MASADSTGVPTQWYEMERLMAEALAEAGMEFSGEHHSSASETGLAEVSYGGQGRYKFDFLIPGEIPTVIEIKHSWLGNIGFSGELPLAALEVFAKCRTVLIIIGETSNSAPSDLTLWSKVSYFAPDASDAKDIRRKALTFARNLLEELSSTRVLTREDAKGKSFAFPKSGVVGLFGDNVELAINTVSIYFSSLVEPDKMEAVKVEMDQLKTEYISGHFTACALRLGRTLELATYAFAGIMGEPTQNLEHQAISAVQGSIREPGQDMNELNFTSADPDSPEYNRARSRLIKSITVTQTALLNLAAAVDALASDDLVPAGRANVDFLLRRAQKSMHRKQASKEAKAEISKLINEGLTRKILSLSWTGFSGQAPSLVSEAGYRP